MLFRSDCCQRILLYMTSAFLIINALMYLGFGIWCALYPGWTSEGVGFTILGQKGMSEYTAVYGGLQFGVGLFYLLSYLDSRIQFAAIVFSICFYPSLAIFRTYSIVKHGADIQTAYYFFTAEVLFAVWAISLYLKATPSQS